MLHDPGLCTPLSTLILLQRRTKRSASADSLDPGGERGASFALFRRMLGSLSSAEVEDLLRADVLARLGCHAEGRTASTSVKSPDDSSVADAR